MLLADGGGLLSPESVRLMTTDHLTQEQRDASTLFLEGAGWGFGGSVGRRRPLRLGRRHRHDRARRPVPPAPSAILFTQVQMTGPTPTPLMREFWQYAFRAARMSECASA